MSKSNRLSYEDYLSGYSYASVYDKKASERHYVNYDLARTNNMFEWHGLPDTIPARNLELMLQTRGHCAILKVDKKDGGGLYAFTGGLGGTPTRYLEPSLYIVANPTLKRAYNAPIYYPGQSGSYEIAGANAEPCILVRNDPLLLGLYPLFARYASMLVENDISLVMTDILSRISYAITAGDDTAKASAQKFLDDLTAGKAGILADNDFIESVRTLPLSSAGTSQTLSNLIEYQQYLKASKYNDIGLNANYNMKREAINSNEAQLNNDALLPLVESMLDERQAAARLMNELFDWNVTVELSNAWAKNQENVEAVIANDEAATEPANEFWQEGTEAPDEAPAPSDDDNAPDETSDEAPDEAPDARIEIDVNIDTDNQTEAKDDEKD